MRKYGSDKNGPGHGYRDMIHIFLQQSFNNHGTRFGLFQVMGAVVVPVKLGPDNVHMHRTRSGLDRTFAMKRQQSDRGKILSSNPSRTSLKKNRNNSTCIGLTKALTFLLTEVSPLEVKDFIEDARFFFRLASEGHARGRWSHSSRGIRGPYPRVLLPKSNLESELYHFISWRGYTRHSLDRLILILVSLMQSITQGNSFETLFWSALTRSRTQGVPPHLKDHMRNMPTSRIRCGPY